MFASDRQLSSPYSNTVDGLEDDLIPVRAEIYQAGKELQTRIQAMGGDVSNWLMSRTGDQPGEQGFLTAWNSFVSEFQDWDPDNENWYLDRWGRRNEVLAFRKRFAGLQEWFKALGAFTATPAYKPDELPSKSPWTDIARYAVYVLVAGVAVYGAVNLLPFFASLKTGLRLRRNPSRRRIRRRRSRR